MSLCEPTSFCNFYGYLIMLLRWVDRDMFMRYFGGGIGHQTQATTWASRGQKDPPSDGMDVDPKYDNSCMAYNQDAQLQELRKLAVEVSARPAESDDEDINSSDSDNSEDDSSVEGHSHDSDSDGDVDDHESYFGPEDGEGYDKDDDGFADF